MYWLILNHRLRSLDNKIPLLGTLRHCLSPTRFCYMLPCKFPLAGWQNYSCDSAQASSILKLQLSGKHFTEPKCAKESVTLYRTG